MAAVKNVRKEMASSEDADAALMESPLKLVEQTLNAVSLRQRIGSSAISPGMHFKAPGKSIYGSALSTLDSAEPCSTVLGKTPSFQKSVVDAITYSKDGATIQAPEKDKSLVLNNSTGGSPMAVRSGDGSPTAATTPGDESQHSSTSEYGSMADTHSSVSDSRLSSPALSRNASKTTTEWRNQRSGRDQSGVQPVYHHEKSPSWPGVYYNVTASVPDLSASNTAQRWHSSGSPPSSLPDSSTPTSQAPDVCYVPHSLYSACGHLEPEHQDAGDTNTLRRCSAQSMREICPKLLKKLHKHPQQSPTGRRQGHQERARWQDESAGRSDSDDQTGRIPRQMTIDDSTNAMTSGNAEATGYGKSDLYKYSSFANGSVILHESSLRHEAGKMDAAGQRSLSSENITGKLRGTENGAYYHSSAIFSTAGYSPVSAINSYSHIRNIDEDDEEGGDYRPSTTAHSDKSNCSQNRVRYQQRNQHGAPGTRQLSIRKKRRQAAAEVAPARSLPDLTDQHQSASDQFPANCNAAQSNEIRQQRIEDDALAYATSQGLTSHYSFTTAALYAVPNKASNQQFMTTKASPPPPLPRKPPPPPPTAVEPAGDADRMCHCSDSGQQDERDWAERTGNSVAMITRKLFADQIRANKLIDPSPTVGMNGQKTQPKTPQYPSANPVYTTNFPPTSANRRVVQVHPMCMNAPSDQDPPSDDRQNGAQLDAQLAQCSIQNGDPQANKARPPVPKKPARLAGTTSMLSKTHQPVPLRPLKPLPNGEGEYQNGRGSFKRDSGLPAGKTSSSFSGTSNASPFKQRKQLEDEEKCRELTNYVALKSNDSSLKQILAPNQRCSVDYLEECFANGKLTGPVENDHGEEFGAKKTEKKHGVYANGQGGLSRRQSHPLRAFSTESVDLEKEKIDLIARMSRKLKVLKEEQRAVEDEIRCNNELGASLVALVDEPEALTKSAKDRFRQFIVDIENVTQLLLKLSVQLARIDNEMNRITNAGQFNEKFAKEKRQQLTERRQRLVEQLHDAKDLKEDVDRRGEHIVSMLKSVLSPDSLADYQYFVQMKYKLLLDAREIDDKIKLGEDQKCALEQSLSKT